MMEPPLLVFDVGSTLIHPDICALADWLAGKTGIAVAQDLVERAFRKAVSGDPFASGDEDRKGNAFFTLCGSPDSQRGHWQSWWREVVQAGGAGSWLYSLVDPDAEAMLGRLKSRDCRLIAASNNDGTLRTELEGHGLASFFEATFDSTDLGFAKPQAEFYAHILSATGAPISIHVGDDLVNDYIGALAAGFDRALLYDPANIFLGLPPGARIGRLPELEIWLDTLV
jgi:FMN phosphatase YigB (HAD superfamily)